MINEKQFHTRYKRVDYSKSKFPDRGCRQTLWSHWSDLATHSATHHPTKKDINLSALGRTLPYTILRKRLGPNNVTLRIVGEEIDAIKPGFDKDKNLFDIIDADIHSYAEYLFSNICTNSVGFSICEEIITPTYELLTVKSLFLPLLGEDGTTNYVISTHDISPNGFYKGDLSNIKKSHSTPLEIIPIDLGYGIPEQFNH